MIDEQSKSGATEDSRQEWIDPAVQDFDIEGITQSGPPGLSPGDGVTLYS